LDIVGTGPELEACRALTSQLGLEDRVRFLGWYTRHEELLDSLSTYRGMVLPTMEDANGIVVQEAMALGLPPICLDWGGPQLLIEHGRDGYLVEPRDKEFITDKIAEHLDFLSQNGAAAEHMSVAARTKAGSWRWSQLAEDWLRLYPVSKRSVAPPNGAFAASQS
jgi:glycosyltransferase involved in cell wall biosynthesis